MHSICTRSTSVTNNVLDVHNDPYLKPFLYFSCSVTLLVPLQQPQLKRSLSHENLNAETHGEVDTASARIYAKDDTNEHRSL
jgi:hypothetical protein